MESVAKIASELLPAEPALFDYAGFNEGQRQTLRIRASEINTLAKRAVQDVIEIGRKFAEVKDILGGNGKFNDWLSAELGWSERTAYNFIGVYAAFGSADFAIENFAASALTLLAAPSTPPAAIEAAAQMANSGERVTHAIAKEIVRQAKKAKPAQVALIEEAAESLAESPQNIPENIPAETPGCGVGTPFPTEYTQAELEEMPEQTFTRIEQEAPAVIVPPCFHCSHAADFHSEGGCGECLCTGYKPDHRTDDEYWAEVWATEKTAKAQSVSDVDLKAAARREALFDEATIEINLTVTPRSKKDAAGRLMVGSIAASGREPMFFDGRGDQASIPSLIREALSRFIEDLDSRPASKPAASKQEAAPDAGGRKRKSR